MYEDKSYEYLLEEKIAKIKEETGRNAEEGGLLYSAVSPNSWETSLLYSELEYMYDIAFADTADKEHLVRRAMESGMVAPNSANPAVLKAEFNCEIPIGSRFSLDELDYFVLETLNNYNYKIQCETPGSLSNSVFGELTPIDYIHGFESGKIIELITPGEDEEDTEHYRERYFAKVQRPSTSGNRYDYYNWAMEVPGAGAVKVFPLALGPGTVKLVITDSERNAATDELTQKVTDYIEELRPIGATVTIISAKEKEINVTANVKLQEGVNPEDVKDVFSNLLKGHLKENAFESNYVSIARLGNLLLDVSGLIDYAQLEINGQTGNVPLNDEEIAVIGTVSLGGDLDGR